MTVGISGLLLRPDEGKKGDFFKKWYYYDKFGMVRKGIKNWVENMKFLFELVRAAILKNKMAAKNG